jgi:hypothetical protein
MASPRPTAAQVGMIVAGAAAGAVVSFAVGIGGAIGGAMIGIGAALGAIPYSRAIQEQKKRDGG